MAHTLLETVMLLYSCTLFQPLYTCISSAVYTPLENYQSQAGLKRGFVDFFLNFGWDRQTDGQTDRRTDRRTDLGIEASSRSLKKYSITVEDLAYVCSQDLSARLVDEKEAVGKK
jgi:hypothetical protein